MPSVNAEQLKTGLIAYFETPKMAEAIEQLKTGFHVSALLVVATEAVQVVEKLAADMNDVAGTGEAKKKAVKQWLDDVIKLPAILEWADDIAINGFIDGLITWYNFKHGKDWVTKITSVL